MSRTLDEIYWDSCCDEECKCKDLQEALQKHPVLEYLRENKEPVFTLKAQDQSAPALVQTWIQMNMKTAPAEKILSAQRVMLAMRDWPKKKAAD